MPHVTGHDAGEEMTDYSDFEHQHVAFFHFNRQADTNTDRQVDIDVMEDKGGLDGDQVAELVYASVQVRASPDGLNDIIGQDQAEGSYEFRGAFGSDIDKEDIPTDGANKVTEPVESSANSTTDPSVFHQFDEYAMIGFSDAAAGAGGGGTVASSNYEIDFRSIFGRGPVLDAADNLSLSSRVVKNNVAADIEANYNVTLVWDTATIEGDRRQFSVP